MPRRWYQTIDIDGENQVFEDFNRIHSNYWNEGKWHNFIEPLLPKERQTFLEIGCNAGLYLEKARQVGFERVIGVEGRGQIMRQAETFKEVANGDWQLVLQHVGTNFELADLALPDVVLISNMHYYLPIGVFSKLVDSLRNRCLYCIVVSAKAKRRQGNALYDLKSVRGYFRDWREVDVIYDLDVPEDDPSPRPQMYGVVFKSNMDSVAVSDVYDPWKKEAEILGHEAYGLAPYMEGFFRDIFSGDTVVYEDTQFYEYWRQREPKRSTEWTIKRLAYKEELARSIQENGMKEPIYFGRRGKLLDGIHRIVIAKLLGYKHIISRRL
jgi:hypothetical protein